jgi:hypothetical protein
VFPCSHLSAQHLRVETNNSAGNMEVVRLFGVSDQPIQSLWSLMEVLIKIDLLGNYTWLGLVNNRVIWIGSITICQSWRYTITIHLLRNIPLQLQLSLIHSILYISQPFGPIVRRTYTVHLSVWTFLPLWPCEEELAPESHLSLSSLTLLSQLQRQQRRNPNHGCATARATAMCAPAPQLRTLPHPS